MKCTVCGAAVMARIDTLLARGDSAVELEVIRYAA